MTDPIHCACLFIQGYFRCYSCLAKEVKKMEDCRYIQWCKDEYGECPCEKDNRDCTECDVYDRWALVDEDFS